MKKAIRFAAAAAAPNDNFLVLAHLCIKGGKVQGTNGILVAEAPIGLPFDALVHAKQLGTAFNAVRGQIAVTLGEGHVRVKGGDFNAKLPTLADEGSFPWHEKPDGETAPAEGLLASLQKLRPFICQEQTKPLFRGVHISKGVAYATDSITLAACKAPKFKTPVTLPLEMVDAIIKVGEEPDSITVHERGIAFAWGDRWLRSLVLIGEWPPLDAYAEPCATAAPILEGFADAVDRVASFAVDDGVALRNGVLTTVDGDTSAQVTGFDGMGDCQFDAARLQKVLTIATHLDLTKGLSPWYGADMWGAIAQRRG